MADEYLKETYKLIVQWQIIIAREDHRLNPWASELQKQIEEWGC